MYCLINSNIDDILDQTIWILYDGEFEEKNDPTNNQKVGKYCLSRLKLHYPENRSKYELYVYNCEKMFE